MGPPAGHGFGGSIAAHEGSLVAGPSIIIPITASASRHPANVCARGPPSAATWTGDDGPVVYLVTDTDGGDLADAWATLALPPSKPAPEFVSACARPLEMCATVALAIGDLDDDGAADLVMGWDSEVRVFRGPFPAGEIPLASATHWLRGIADADQFGHALLIGDVTLDGRTDLVVGAPDEWDHTGVPPHGRVYVLSELFGGPVP